MGEYAEDAMSNVTEWRGGDRRPRRHYDERAARNRAEPGSGLAKLRIAAHGAFDPLWKSGEMSRSAAYRWLARALGIAQDDCHIVYFDEAQCQQVVHLCNMRDFSKLAGDHLG